MPFKFRRSNLQTGTNSESPSPSTAELIIFTTGANTSSTTTQPRLPVHLRSYTSFCAYSGHWDPWAICSSRGNQDPPPPRGSLNESKLSFLHWRLSVIEFEQRHGLLQLGNTQAGQDEDLKLQRWPGARRALKWAGKKNFPRGSDQSASPSRSSSDGLSPVSVTYLPSLSYQAVPEVKLIRTAEITPAAQLFKSTMCIEESDDSPESDSPDSGRSSSHPTAFPAPPPRSSLDPGSAAAGHEQHVVSRKPWPRFLTRRRQNNSVSVSAEITAMTEVDSPLRPDTPDLAGSSSIASTTRNSVDFFVPRRVDSLA
ncbi:hypothetical protein OC845_004876 [Tilletia horrida]|nr:hypothetical protein OC845_004876 [Tilletia horrida]